MPRPFYIDTPPLTLRSIRPGIWVVTWDHYADEPTYIGITLANVFDKSSERLSLSGYRVLHRRLIGPSGGPYQLGLSYGDTGLDPSTVPSIHRTYHLPMQTKFSNVSDITIVHALSV